MVQTQEHPYTHGNIDTMSRFTKTLLGCIIPKYS